MKSLPLSDTIFLNTEAEKSEEHMIGYAPFLGPVRLVRSPWLGQERSAPPLPSASSSSETRAISGAEAAYVLRLLTDAIEKAPECFDGEDLSVAYGLRSLLQKYGQTTLNEDGARVVAAVERCATTKAPPPGGGAASPAATTAFPIVPIAGGLAAAGLLAYLIFW